MSGVVVQSPRFPEFGAFLGRLAEASGEVIRRAYRPGGMGAVEHKDDGSPVTDADREAELVMRDMIRRAYPAHGILAEEFGSENTDAEFVWVLDPIDGTVSFAAGCPLFGTLIGLLHRGEPVLGAIHQPVTGQLCHGDGAAAWLDGRPTRVRGARSFAEATLCVTDARAVAAHWNGDAFDALCRECRIVRGWGDCHGYLLLAGGGIDIMCDALMNPWDLLPLIPIVTGAGGSITGWDGASPLDAASCLASNPALHDSLVRRLNP